MTETTKPTGLALLRVPFPDHQIGYLAKASKAQNEEAKANRAMGISCKVCHTFHHKHAVHLDYVGHAAVTDRLLDADPLWSWEPVAFGANGLPMFDEIGGLWIRLTICGHTRLGYGNAEKKSYSDMGAREKEVIGDALRNAAMRFGVALNLWHKGELHPPEEKDDDAIGADSDAGDAPTLPPPPAVKPGYPEAMFTKNLPGWRNDIAAGKYTVAALVAKVTTRGRLTDEQMTTLRSLESPPAV